MLLTLIQLLPRTANRQYTKVSQIYNSYKLVRVLPLSSSPCTQVLGRCLNTTAQQAQVRKQKEDNEIDVQRENPYAHLSLGQKGCIGLFVLKCYCVRVEYCTKVMCNIIKNHMMANDPKYCLLTFCFYFYSCTSWTGHDLCCDRSMWTGIVR